MKNAVGEARRSHLVLTYGPGAIIDMRTPEGSPVSGVLAGLEEWDNAAGQGRKGLNHAQTAIEPRLQQRLRVDGFRLPPIKKRRKPWEKENVETTTDVLPMVRFPDWLQCPNCNRLNPSAAWQKDPGKPDRWCARCSGNDGEPVAAVPVRFVTACEDGHLDEFPWKGWIGCNCDDPSLVLESRGPGLAGNVLFCKAKGCASKVRSMEGVFAKDALSGFACRCREPWLAVPPGTACNCGKDRRAVQRGASNVYWSISMSSLDIPPFSEDVSQAFGAHWASLRDADPANWESLIEMMKLARKLGETSEVLLAKLERWRNAIDGQEDDEPIEWAEYRQFQNSLQKAVTIGSFQTVPEPTPPELRPWLSGIVLAKRLREIRAQTGFTRIRPPGSPGQVEGRLGYRKRNWLPAVELNGEGFYMQFNEDRIRKWEGLPAVKQRVAELNCRRREVIDPEVYEDISPRFVMIHSFAHALMLELSLSSGYGSSALRERLYAATGSREMCGVLLHTGTSDSEGTLGGLVRQGRGARVLGSVLDTITQIQWCSSDPICISGAATLSSPKNGAACHACLLVPETSCQHFNVSLDRALLVGTPTDPDIGYFNGLLQTAT